MTLVKLEKLIQRTLDRILELDKALSGPIFKSSKKKILEHNLKVNVDVLDFLKGQARRETYDKVKLRTYQ